MKMVKMNVKSNSGFTMVDLVAAITIFVLFTTVISTVMYSSYKMNIEVKVSGEALYYAMQILEDIDKISYENIKNGMEEAFIKKFSIPEGLTINIDVSNYNEGTLKEDLIKKIKLTISHTLEEKTETLVINKIKVKEL